jgi:hypothetical protein
LTAEPQLSKQILTMKKPRQRRGFYSITLA